MQVKEFTKFQFLVTITPSEHLIIEGYAKLFNTTLQSAALVMCIRGWTSYAEWMIQYNKNCKVVPTSLQAQALLDNESKLITASDEAVTYRNAMKEIATEILEIDDGNSHTLASSGA